MHFRIARTAFLRQLTAVVGVAPRAATMPVLGNLLLDLAGHTLQITATDLEVEARATALDVDGTADGRTTVSAKKLLDIVRALPDSNDIGFKLATDGKVVITAGKSRFTLATLPAQEFPEVVSIGKAQTIDLPASALRRVLARTAFAMANGDIRTFLNGVLIEVKGNRLCCVGSDGHRMAIAEVELADSLTPEYAGILPRKGVEAMMGALPDDDRTATLALAKGHIALRVGGVSMTSRLIAATFPNYAAIVPVENGKHLKADRNELRGAVHRASLFAHPKHRAIRLSVTDKGIRLLATEDAAGDSVEEVQADSTIAAMDFGVNFQYLQAALDAVDTDVVRLCLRDAGASMLVIGDNDPSQRHVVMPMRL